MILNSQADKTGSLSPGAISGRWGQPVTVTTYLTWNEEYDISALSVDGYWDLSRYRLNNTENSLSSFYL